MDRIRDVVGELRRDESANLQPRLAAADAIDEWLRFASIASLFGVLGVGAFSLTMASASARR